MIFLILFLLVCNVAIPLVFVFRQCTSKGRIELNHVLLFTIGYLAYWITPIAVGESHLFETAPGMPLWYGVFDRIPQETVLLYLFMALSIYLAFCAGVLLCRHLRPGINTDTRRLFFDRRLLNVYLALGLTAAFIYTLTFRNALFRGYTLNNVDPSAGEHGSFVAVSIFLLSLAILYSLKRQENAPNIRFWQAISHHFFVSYFVVAVLVLSLGGRLYFLSSVIMLGVYRTVYFQTLSYRTFFFSALVALAAVGGIGTLRLGAGVSVGDGLFNLITEPLYNSFSLMQFLADGRFDLIKAPLFLAGDFINLIPTVILPGKGALLLNPDNYGYHVFSPLGSLSTFFSFMINFGILGTLAVMFLVGFFLQLLRSRGRSLLSKTTYIMLCGWLATSFFRDPFAASLVKSMFQYSVLLPTIVVFSASLVTYWLVEAPRRVAADAGNTGALEND